VQTELRVSFDYSRHCKNRSVHLVVHVNIDHDITGDPILIPQTLVVIVRNLIITAIADLSEASPPHRDIPASDSKRDTKLETAVRALATQAGMMASPSLYQQIKCSHLHPRNGRPHLLSLN
jgi:hypothetical protein